MAEQLIRNERVGGSIPLTSSRRWDPQDCLGSEDFLMYLDKYDLIKGHYSFDFAAGRIN